MSQVSHWPPASSSGTVSAIVFQGTIPWVVAGTVTVNQGTSPWLTSRNWTLDFATDQVDASGSSVSISNFPATVAVTQATSPWVVSGTVAATQSGTWTTGRTWTLNSGTDSVSVSNFPGSFSVTQGTTPWVDNITQFGSNPVVTGTGASGLGIPRVTVSNDSNILATQSGVWTTGRTWTLAFASDKVDASGSSVSISNFPATVAVTQSTTPWIVSGTVTANQGGAPWSQNLIQVGGAAISLGQTSSASSLPVVTQADSAPATQNITTQDVASVTTAMANGQNFITGSPTAGSTASFTVASFESVEVLVTGTWTGTLSSEISMDSGVTWFTRGVKQAGAAYISSSFTQNFAGGLNISGMTNYRIRATAAMTGTATVKIILSINAASITVTNPLTLRDATTQSITSTIKAASTAALATDTALVVALSPNSPAPIEASATSTITRVSASASSVQLLASNTGRKAAYLFNDSTSIAYVKFGTTASNVSYTVFMYPNRFLAINADPVYTGRIDAIWTSATGAMQITELT